MKLKATKMFKSNIQLDNQHQFSKIDNPFTERWAGHSPNREIIQPKQPSFVEASLAVKTSNGSNLSGEKKHILIEFRTIRWRCESDMPRKHDWQVNKKRRI